MKRLLIISFFAAFTFILNVHAKAQHISWLSSAYDSLAGQLAPGRGVFITATTIDEKGNSYVAYSASEDINVNNVWYPGGSSPQNYLSYNCHIVKYNTDGTVVWVKHLYKNPNAGSTIGVNTLFVDRNANLYATGTHILSANIDGVNMPNTTYYNSYLAKWDSAGTIDWVVPNIGRSPKTIAVAKSGTIYVGGKNGTSYNGTTPTNSIAFLKKFTADGALQLTLNAGGSGNTIDQIQIDENGELYLLGRVHDTFEWGPANYTNLASTTFWDGFSRYWMRCDTTGQVVAHKLLAGFDNFQSSDMSASEENQIGPAMVVDQEGYTYVASKYAGTADLGGITFTSTAPTGPGIYIAKYDPNGALQWGKQISLTTTDYEAINVTIAKDEIGNVFFAGTNNWGSASFGNNQLSPNMNNFAFILTVDAFTGNYKWSKLFSTSNLSPLINKIYLPKICANSSGQLRFGGTYGGTYLLVDSTQFNSQAHPSRYVSFFTRISNDNNTIQGTAFIDHNSNSLQDASEMVIPGGIIVGVTPGQGSFVSTDQGSYAAIAGIGNFTVSIPNPIPYHTLVPLGQTTASFSSFGNSVNGYDFAFQPIPDQQDVRVIVTAVTATRPGFTVRYRVTCKNVGTSNIADGTVTLALNNPLLTFDSSSVAPIISANQLTWAYSNLLAQQSLSIDVYFTLSTGATLNDTLLLSSTIGPIAGDLDPTNNSDTLRSIVTGSYDPNEIEVNYQQLSPQQVQTGEWLEYIIRFQNMGTDTAFTVMLRDSLPASLLNLGTIEMLSASNNYTWSLDANGIMTVLFTSILLPHEAINEPASHGFVRFRVKPQPGLAVGAIIPNQAKIYFDYNPYIATNTATTEVIQPTGLQDILAADNWRIYPNPATDKLVLVCSSAESGPVTISLVNVLGQEVLKTRAVAGNGLFRNELNLQPLPNGIYTVRIKTENSTVSKAVVKQ